MLSYGDSDTKSIGTMRVGVSVCDSVSTVSLEGLRTVIDGSSVDEVHALREYSMSSIVVESVSTAGEECRSSSQHSSLAVIDGSSGDWRTND